MVKLTVAHGVVSCCLLFSLLLRNDILIFCLPFSKAKTEGFAGK
jgi:hypothetical protein